MRKIVIILIFAVNLGFSQGSFFKGIGFFVAATQSCHNYKNLDQDKKDFANDNPGNFNDSYYYPQSHVSKEYFNVISGGLFAEFSKRDNIRWQTELEYIKKGAREKEVTNHFTGERAGGFSTNKYVYFQWNNYLKFYNPIGYKAHWYLMPGVRIEYLFRKSISAMSPVAGGFPTFWFSASIGAGYEAPLVKNWYWFAEYHWNPDVLAHKIGNVKARNRTFELRVGLVWRPKQRKIDDCNAPRYNGPAY